MAMFLNIYGSSEKKIRENAEWFLKEQKESIKERKRLNLPIRLADKASLYRLQLLVDTGKYIEQEEAAEFIFNSEKEELKKK